MSFERSLIGIRSRFADVTLLLNFLDAGGLAPRDPANVADGAVVDIVAPSTPEKAVRGLFLVALYGAVESSVNAVVAQALAEVSLHSLPISACTPHMQAAFMYPRIQSVRDCAPGRLIEKALALFTELRRNSAIQIEANPFQSMLQNVDGSTMELVAAYMGIPGYSIDNSARARLNNLRERRNAVAHGRESPSDVGERFRVDELRRLNEVANSEVDRFAAKLRDHFENQRYTI